MQNFSTSEQSLQNLRFRNKVAFYAAGIFFSLIIMRLVWLQIFNHDVNSTKAENNRVSFVAAPPHRGLIYDRNGVVLANNISGYTLELTPYKMKNLDETITALSKLIRIEKSDIRRFKRLKEDAGRFDSTPIRSRLTDEEVAIFAAHKYLFPGVEIRARLLREYPFGERASHVIGYIGRISEKDMTRLDEENRLSNYRGTVHIGKEGVERSYEEALHGITGVEKVEVTAGGKPIQTLSRTPPVTGKNLILSIDIELQKIAEDAFGTRRGALVAIQPSTGDVLAFVSRPGFDPNLFIDGIDSENWKALNESPDKPLLNRPIYGLYPIGSTYKPFVGLAALELGKRDMLSTMYDPGYLEFGGRRFRNAGMAHYGLINLFKAIQVSSDTYFYAIGRDLGADAIHDFMKPFGFGQITGIDLFGEKKGILPSVEWKKNRFKKAGPKYQKWLPGENLSIAVGQGYNSFTLLQLAHATAVLANNGVVMKPHLVKALEENHSGKRVLTVQRPSFTIPLNPEHVDYIKKAMAAVVQGGTASRSFGGTPYQAAGKTGTAQVVGIKDGERYNAARLAEEHRDHALFMGFAPLENPDIAVAVIVENAGWGGVAAAPIARQVFDYWLVTRHIKKETDHEEPST